MSKANYEKLLNNLLQIRRGDSSLFTKVNNTSYFDVLLKFGSKQAQSVFQPKFKIKPQDNDLEELKNKIDESDYIEDIIDAYRYYKERISSKIKLSFNIEPLEKVKKLLKEEVDIKIQKKWNRWNKYYKEIEQLYRETGVWHLYIATCFIKVKVNQKTIYGPLILREAKIDFIQKDCYFSEKSNWVINQKLTFLLEKLKLPKAIDFNEDIDLSNLDDIIGRIKKLYSLYALSAYSDFISNFESLKSEDIENKSLEFMPGIVLGTFTPLGGPIREAMAKIIENQEVDDILPTITNKNECEELVFKDFKENINLINIQATNYAQNKAIISALKQNTLIWGPPGTGKSQVIANLITNILGDGSKFAVVMSKKKAALDVLIKRLDPLNIFCFFFSSISAKNKQDFYEPLQKWLKKVNDYRSTYSNNLPTNELISSEEINLLDRVKIFKDTNKYEDAIILLEVFKDKQNLLFDFFDISLDFKYPNNYFDDIKAYFFEALKLNNINFNEQKYFFDLDDDSLELLYECEKVLKFINVFNFTDKYDFNYVNTLKREIDFSKLTRFYSQYKYEKSKSFTPEYAIEYLERENLKRIKKIVDNWRFNNRQNYIKYTKMVEKIKSARSRPIRFLQDHWDLIRVLFRVFITTPEISFLNWKKDEFDYIIIDEASQIFLEEGLPMLYMGKTKIIAGDPQQMKPTHWFTIRTKETEEDLDQDYVAEQEESILDYALTKNMYEVMLDQNFRSHSASLMSFSSKHFYESRLEVIDKFGFDANKCFEIHDIDGVWEKSINEKEVEWVVDLLKKNLRYFKTIIVLAFNIKQKNAINDLFYSKDECEEIRKRIDDGSVMLKNIENIQGDEADLVIMSIVYDKNTSLHSTYIGGNNGKNSLNVAISRAKSKVIVIKSIKFSDVRIGASNSLVIFKNWLQFLELDIKNKTSYTISNNNKVVQIYKNIETWRKQIVKSLFEIFPSYESSVIYKFQEWVGSKSIDIVFYNSFNNEYILGLKLDYYNYLENKEENYIENYLQYYSQIDFFKQKKYKILTITHLNWTLKKAKIIDKILNKINFYFSR